MVQVLDPSTGSLFQRQIAAEYCHHLRWIQEESVGNSDRCRWLCNVLDCFAEELENLPNTMNLSWRSRSLNPLLVRAFYLIPDSNAKMVEKEGHRVLRTTTPLLKDWQAFYIDIDVISSSYESLWNERKPKTAPQICKDNLNSTMEAQGEQGASGEDMGMKDIPAFGYLYKPLTQVPADQRDEKRDEKMAQPSQPQQVERAISPVHANPVVLWEPLSKEPESTKPVEEKGMNPTN